MLFNSLGFIAFFPIAVIVYYLLPHKIRHFWLLGCSYFFYMCWNAKYALLMLTSTLVTYLSGIVIGKIDGSNKAESIKLKHKKLCVTASFVINLGILIFFKYTNFILSNVRGILSCFGMSLARDRLDIVLPVGISFFTFQALSYTADVFRKCIEPEKDFFKYALFVSFFPQLVAGPIERSADLLIQFKDKIPFKKDNIKKGLMLMLWGYFLKIVIADNASVIVDTIFNDHVAYGGWYLVVGIILFAIQVYCDFSGYSTIALGAARVMGFKLTDNFNAPYLSRSIGELWKRWHITLNSWFVDYLYIPLGGSRKGKARKYLNILIVFFASGLWHGAAWTYVAWGVINGIYSVLEDITKNLRKKINCVLRADVNSFSHNVLQILITFALTLFSDIFFRANSIDDAVSIVKSIFTADNPWIFFDGSLFKLGLNQGTCFILFISVLVLLFSDICKYRGIVVHEFILKQELWFRWAVLLTGILFVVVFGVWGSGYNAAAFIYFQF